MTLPAAAQAAALRKIMAMIAAIAATHSAFIVGKTEDGATVGALRTPGAGGVGGSDVGGYRPMLHTSIVPGAAGPSAMRVPPGFLDMNLVRPVGNGTGYEVGIAIG